MTNESEPILICEGEFELLRIKKDLFDQVIKFFQNYFVRNEPICKALNAVNVAIAPVMSCLEDQVSFAVRNHNTKEIVAININKMTKASEFGDDYKCRTPDQFISRLRKSFDLFKEWNIDCVFELAFMATHSNFNGRGLATILTKHSIEFARQMHNGTLKEKDSLPAHVRDLKPPAVCSIFSSKYTQKLGEKMGMQTLAKIPYTELFYEGKSFAETMDPIHECVTYMAIKL